MQILAGPGQGLGQIRLGPEPRWPWNRARPRPVSPAAEPRPASWGPGLPLEGAIAPARIAAPIDLLCDCGLVEGSGGTVWPAGRAVASWLAEQQQFPVGNEAGIRILGLQTKGSLQASVEEDASRCVAPSKYLGWSLYNLDADGNQNR